MSGAETSVIDQRTLGQTDRFSLVLLLIILSFALILGLYEEVAASHASHCALVEVLDAGLLAVVLQCIADVQHADWQLKALIASVEA